MPKKSILDKLFGKGSKLNIALTGKKGEVGLAIDKAKTDLTRVERLRALRKKGFKKK